MRNPYFFLFYYFVRIYLKLVFYLLGDKHKIKPVGLEDSVEENEVQAEALETSKEDAESTAKDPTQEKPEENPQLPNRDIKIVLRVM